MGTHLDGGRVLVTGGAGFLGSHLCERLLADGHEVLCLDNLFSSSKENIAPLLGNPRFEFVRHDVVQPYLAEVDQIYNLACPASPVHYQFNPVKTTKTSVMGAINMLGLAEHVIRLTGSSSQIVHKPLPDDDPRQRQPDITLARTRLGWEPSVPLEAGLRETVAYFKAKLSHC